MRQFAAIGEDWPLDFIHLDSGDDDTFSVLAAAISSELVDQIRATCRSGELVPRRLILRPFAAASLMQRHTGDVGGCRLMVDMLSEEADLTVVSDIDSNGDLETVRYFISGSDLHKTIDGSSDTVVIEDASVTFSGDGDRVIIYVQISSGGVTTEIRTSFTRRLSLS